MNPSPHDGKSEGQSDLRLGIVVVYLVAEEDSDLLDLHLSQIERLTELPFTIYGSANRLLPQFRERLQEHPSVRICACPDTPLRGYEEHAFYLEELIRIALDDGVTHIAMFNVDSFPIRRGWAREMAGRLSDDCVLSAVVRVENDDLKPHPSGLLFHRSFYLQHQPTILLSAEQQASPEYARYQESNAVVADTGIGYGFKLFTANLGWDRLERSNQAEEHYIIGSIYGDLVFHLGGAARDAKYHIRERREIDRLRQNSMIRRLFVRVLRFGSSFVPLELRRRLRPYIVPRSTRQIQARAQDAYETARKQLLADPDAFFSYLRSGARVPTDPQP